MIFLESNVLIVPLWNWNQSAPNNFKSAYDGSNCTFMELKYVRKTCKEIERKYGSNCTFMELKLEYII